MEIWNKLKQPPKSALKQIKGGRLKGMTDVNPQWRYQAMTETFGPCGEGWKYEIIKLWLANTTVEDQVCAFAEIALSTWSNERNGWNDPIPGIGGSMLVAKEKNGPYVSDEAYKMAVTDALSVAMKMLGMAADVYAGLWDGSKYRDAPATKGTPESNKESNGQISQKQWDYMKKIATKKELTESELIDIVKWVAEKNKIEPRHWKIGKLLLPEENFETVFTEYCEWQSNRNEKDEDDIPY
jgi:hypothetical protein